MNSIPASTTETEQKEKKDEVHDSKDLKKDMIDPKIPEPKSDEKPEKVVIYDKEDKIENPEFTDVKNQKEKRKIEMDEEKEKTNDVNQFEETDKSKTESKLEMKREEEKNNIGEGTFQQLDGENYVKDDNNVENKKEPDANSESVPSVGNEDNDIDKCREEMNVKKDIKKSVTFDLETEGKDIEENEIKVQVDNALTT